MKQIAVYLTDIYLSNRFSTKHFPLAISKLLLYTNLYVTVPEL